jgi:hypothetical protein
MSEKRMEIVPNEVTTRDPLTQDDRNWSINELELLSQRFFSHLKTFTGNLCTISTRFLIHNFTVGNKPGGTA